MENLNEIEEILGSKEWEILERDILLQIKKLGILKLFHECLSQNIASTPSAKPDFLQSEVSLHKRYQRAKRENVTKGIPKDNVTIVRSGKSQERKSKRIKELRKRVSNTEPYIFKPHTNFTKSQKCQQRVLSFGWRHMKPVTAKEQREFSEGVKVAS
jgi:RNA polymerase sigma factor